MSYFAGYSGERGSGCCSRDLFTGGLDAQIMLDALISSQTRIKLLLKFFLNSETTAYLRGLESEFGESSNGIRLELNRLEEAGMLVSALEGNKKLYRANTQHPLFSELQALVRKHLGIDQIIAEIVERLGNLEAVYLIGSFARGVDAREVELILIGEVDTAYLHDLTAKAEALIKRKIRCSLYPVEKIGQEDILNNQQTKPLLLWSGKPFLSNEQI
ncbi:MAG: ArsR family transcriptional regulator [Saprospiraceae bacterium]